jgi:hypothetical protein
MQNTFTKVSVGTLVLGLLVGGLISAISNRSLKKEVYTMRTEVASTTIALASTTAQVEKEYIQIGTQLSIDAAKRTAVLNGFGDLFLLRRYLTSSTTVAAKSDLIIPKGCQISKSSQQGGYGDSDESKVLTLGYVRNEASLALYNTGNVDIYEVNCK